MKILIACEFSGIVRDAFIRAGHQAMSCDLLPSESDFGPHYQGDVLDLIYNPQHPANPHGWDMIIAHPPCDYLTVSGNTWFRDNAVAKTPGVLVGAARREARLQAVDFAKKLYNAPVKYVCIENPIGRLSTMWRKPDQIVHPWQHGHGETKSTCLWLKNLPKLEPTNIVEGREHRIWKMPPHPDRWKERSRTYPGIADAMVQKWSNLI